MSRNNFSTNEAQCKTPLNYSYQKAKVGSSKGKSASKQQFLTCKSSNNLAIKHPQSTRHSQGAMGFVTSNRHKLVSNSSRLKNPPSHGKNMTSVLLGLVTQNQKQFYPKFFAINLSVSLLSLYTTLKINF